MEKAKMIATSLQADGVRKGDHFMPALRFPLCPCHGGELGQGPSAVILLLRHSEPQFRLRKGRSRRCACPCKEQSGRRTCLCEGRSGRRACPCKGRGGRRACPCRAARGPRAKQVRQHPQACHLGAPWARGLLSSRAA